MKFSFRKLFSGEYLKSKEKCFALKTDRKPCEGFSLRGSRYCALHQSKRHFFVTAAVAFVSWIGSSLWSQVHPSEELSRLRALAEKSVPVVSVEFARCDLGHSNGKIAQLLQAQFKNYGAVSASNIQFRVIATDLGLKKVYCKVRDSYDHLPPGDSQAFWAQLSVSDEVPPFPEMVVLFESTFGGNSNGKQQSKWVGILHETPMQNLNTIPALLAPINEDQRAYYLTNLSNILKKSGI